ncbi:MAG: hypothetical protein ACYDEP_10655 [Acidimicrobiales bacterium]|jgi:heme exporter protein D
MKYVDAGYVVCLSVLFVYSIGIVLRRRRLLRTVDAVDDAEPRFQSREGTLQDEPVGSDRSEEF